MALREGSVKNGATKVAPKGKFKQAAGRGGNVGRGEENTESKTADKRG